MDSLLTQLCTDRDIEYDGSQLAPHWIYRRFDLLGNALVGFFGECDVKLDHMVDLEDVKKQAPIYSPRMVHFIGEWFTDSLMEGILLQHLFTGGIYEALLERKIEGLRRRGNDIYRGDNKLSVSICTRSSVSVLVHVGINIRTEGTPVPTVGLTELGVDPIPFAQALLERFAFDYAIWQKSRVKVLPR